MIKFKARIREQDPRDCSTWGLGDKIRCIETHTAGFGDSFFGKVTYEKGKIYTVRNTDDSGDTIGSSSAPYNKWIIVIVEGGVFSNHANKFILVAKKRITI